MRGEQMTALAISRDTGPGRALEFLTSELNHRNRNARVLFGTSCNSIADDSSIIKKLLEGIHCLILGMSSSAELAQIEMHAGQLAHEAGIPFGFYADIWDCLDRPWFAPLRALAAFAFVIDTTERNHALETLPRASDRIVVTGNPLWDLSRYSKFDPEEAHAALSVPVTQKVILFPLTKDRATNLELLSAARRIDSELPVKVIVAPHPGDVGNASHYRDYLIGTDVALIHQFPFRDMLPAANLVLNPGSGAGIEAIVQGIPVLEYRDKRTNREVDRLYPNGWKLPEKYPESVKLTTPETLIADTRKALSVQRTWLGQKLTEAVPKLPAASKMAECIERWFF